MKTRQRNTELPQKIKHSLPFLPTQADTWVPQAYHEILIWCHLYGELEMLKEVINDPKAHHFSTQIQRFTEHEIHIHPKSRPRDLENMRYTSVLKADP